LIEPVRYEEGRAMLLAGVRREHTFAGSEASVAAQWREFNAMGPVPGRRGGAAYGVICAGDPEAQTFEYLCGVEVDAFVPGSPFPGRMHVPVQRYAVFEHPGHVSEVRKMWEEIFGDWLPRSGHTPANGPDFELYGERFDPATGLGGVEIWVPVEP
jgi:AraC family transcriptional regulator